MTYYERNLPHWQPPGKDLFVTWRISGSLPLAVLETLRKNQSLPSGKQFLHFDRHLDKHVFGPVWLKDPRLAQLVVAALKNSQTQGLCILHAFVVMPNHVHVLLEPGAELKEITRAVKRESARAANAILGRTGKPFWQDESFDHWIRNSAQLERVRTYIEQNPVSAGLVKRPCDWPWSSAAQ